MIDLESVRDDLAAFADDDEGFALDEAGDLLLHRGGMEIVAKLELRPEGDRVLVEGQAMSYRSFLVRRLGQLDILASRLLEKRPGVPAFVDGPAKVDSADGDQTTLHALAAVNAQCSEATGFRSRVCFLTADAGQGKTALLREYQALTAQRFVDGRSPFVFWHIDLQGRQLLRLSEALMGDLGDLRVAGLWMPAIIRLIRHRALVLAIDGFDELAAEQGGSDALGSLATLVQQLRGQGVVVAASRRAFFDTGDYLRRAGMFGRVVAEPCEFNQITLGDWGREEAISYLTKTREEGEGFDDAEATYESIVASLGGMEDHPMVTKPFLLAHIARGLLRYGVSPSEFVRPPADPQAGVAAVVEAFVHREVADKWRYRDSGDPYLTYEQHMRFLADVAEEMYRAGKDRLPLDLVETLAAMRLDDWDVDPERQRQVMEMVRMHALLQPPTEFEGRSRSFDHPEFRDYFIALALRHHLEDVGTGRGVEGAADYLSISQISDSTGRYVRGLLPPDLNLREVARSLVKAADRQLRSTFLQVNVGTLVPMLIDGTQGPRLELVGRAVYSSLVFEGTSLEGVEFRDATMLNVSLRSVSWTDVAFVNTDMGELTVHDDLQLDGVRLKDCRIEGIRRVVKGEEVERAYAPTRVVQLLVSAGFGIVDSSEDEGPQQLRLLDSQQTVLARRFLQCFSRSNAVTDHLIERRFRAEKKWILDELIPVFVTNQVLEEKTWRGRGTHQIWAMKYPVETILAAEEGGSSNLTHLWEGIRSLPTP